MVTGFNTDVEHEGRVFHVQTEDKGRENPVIESLLYTRGAIVTSRRLSYADIADGPAYSEETVLKMMEAQHQGLIREILTGLFDPEGPKPFGHDIISNRSLDEVVADYLADIVIAAPLHLEIDGWDAAGSVPASPLSIRVLAGDADVPVAGARVVLKLLSSLDKSRDLFNGATGPDGRVEARFEAPTIPAGARTALLVQADAGAANTESIRELERADAEVV